VLCKRSIDELDLSDNISRSLYRYRSLRSDCAGLRERIGEIAAVKRRYGFPNCRIEWISGGM
jgi:hypothetical protein